MRSLLSVALAALMLSGCVTSPKNTVAGLNRRDPEYRTRDCLAARAEADRYAEEENGRRIIAMAGNLIVPFAGAAAAMAMTGIRKDSTEALNRRLKAACTSDPLRHRQRVARR